MTVARLLKVLASKAVLQPPSVNPVSWSKEILPAA